MRSWLVTLSAVVLSLLCHPTLLGAQQSVFRGSVTVTATGDETPVDEVPLPVTVIERQAIEDAQEESVADLLRAVPGVTVARSGDEGAVVSVFTRGTESDHTLALFDGVRLNSPYFGGFDWGLLPTAGLARIEVARGPFSALYGPDAVGGVVNVVPDRAADGAHAFLQGEGGTDGWRRLEAAAGWGRGGFDVYASAFDREGDGELLNSDFASRQLLVDAGWSWAEGSRVAVLVQELESEAGIPFSSPGMMTPERRQHADQRLVAVPLRLRVTSGWDLEVVASEVERDLAFSDPDDPFGFTASDTAADTLELRMASRHRLGAHQLTWGGGWREGEVTDTSSFGPNLDGQTAEVSGAFVQDVWRPGERVAVVAGVRWDDAEEWGSELSPRLSVGVQASDALELRAGYGRAFRQPSVGELYFPFSGNPGLEAERSESAEAGAVLTLGGSRLEAAVFRNEIDDLITFDTSVYAFANIASARISGAEASWDLALPGGLASRLTATWLDTEDAEGLDLLRRPSLSATWTMSGELSDRLRGSVSVLWVGARDDLDATTFERIKLDDHLTGDLALSYGILDTLEVLLRVRNLADARYEEIAGYPAPGRRVSGGLRWRL